MADYSTIKGFTVQSLASDPYATSIAAGTWASGTAMNTARNAGAGAGVSNDAVFGAAGYTGSAPTDNKMTEVWNGSTWTESGDLNTARYYGGAAGTSTSGMFVAGSTTFPGSGPTPVHNNAETFNGTSWTEISTIGTARYANTAAGAVNTAALCMGGSTTPTAYIALTELWNGSAWAEQNDLNTARKGLASAGQGAGTSTSAICVSGQTGSAITNVETWDGTSWSDAAVVNTARTQAATSATDNTAALIAGGSPSNMANTEYFDGTSWTEVGDLGTGGANRTAKGGTTTAAIVGGGGADGSPRTNTVEVWSIPSAISLAQEGQVWYNPSSNVLKGFKKTFGAGTWASGGIMTNARYSFAGFGTQTAAVSATGTGPTPGVITKTEEYNGTAWTEVNDNLSGGDSISGCGTLTAGIINARSPSSLLTESYDGTCWTEVNDMNTPSRGKRTDAGTQTAGLCVGGENHPAVMINTELWDGTSWTEVAGDLNNGRSTQDGGTGTQTAALVAGGTPPTDSPVYDYAETWDGTSWTEVNDLNTARAYGVAFGEQTDCYYAGGVATTLRALVEAYDGTSWTEVADLGTAAKKAAGGGTQTAGIIMGGATTGDPTGLAQEWNVPAPNEIKTFTAS